MVEANQTVKLELPENEVRALLFLIRKRQDECQRVTEEWPTHQKFCEIELNLEIMKQRIARQL